MFWSLSYGCGGVGADRSEFFGAAQGRHAARDFDSKFDILMVCSAALLSKLMSTGLSQWGLIFRMLQFA